MRDRYWPGLIKAVSLRSAGCSRGKEVVAWALECLEERDSPSLRIVAGLDVPPNEFELDRYLRLATEELGYDVPAGNALHLEHARIVAGSILDGTVNPQDGCRALYALCEALGFPDFLLEWDRLDDELGLARSGTFGTVAEAEQRIVAAAKKLLADAP